MKYIHYLVLICSMSLVSAINTTKTEVCVYSRANDIVTYDLKDINSWKGVSSSTEEVHSYSCISASGVLIQEYDISNIHVGGTLCDADPHYRIKHGQSRTINIVGTSESCSVSIDQ